MRHTDRYGLAASYIRDAIVFLEPLRGQERERVEREIEALRSVSKTLERAAHEKSVSDAP
jgi:hypothetical protein